MRFGIDLSPGTSLSERAGIRLSRFLLAAAVLLFVPAAGLSAKRFVEARGIDARAGRMRAETAGFNAEAARFRDAEAWKALRGEAAAYAAAFPKPGPSIPALLAAAERAIPDGVALESVRIDRRDGTIRIEGVSPAFGGAEALRAALPRDRKIPSLAVESNRYDQGRRLHVFRLTGRAGGGR